MCTGTTCASAEAVAANDVEDDIEDRDDDLLREQQSLKEHEGTSGSVLTVTMTETMIIHTLAIAEMTASMAPPIAETIAPYNAFIAISSQMSFHESCQAQAKALTMLCGYVIAKYCVLIRGCVRSLVMMELDDAERGGSCGVPLSFIPWLDMLPRFLMYPTV